MGRRDRNGGPQLTYISLDDHRIVASQLLGDGGRSRADRLAVPSTTYLTPPYSRVGITEKDACAQGGNVKTALKPFAELAMVPRPKILRQTTGVVKAVVDADSDEILGFAHHGIESQEVINLVALARLTGVTATQLRDGIWVHISATELLNEILNGLG